MPGKMIVLVSDLDDGKHGEITVVENPIKAARLLETLLEAGFEQERIRVFSGAEMEMQVTHRPVVALVGSGQPPEDTAPATKDEPPRKAGEEEGDLQETAPRAKAEMLEEAGATPFVKDGARFSTLFRPA